MILEIEIPIPPRHTQPNARAHWRTKAKAAKLQRYDAGMCAKTTLVLQKIPPPHWKEATIRAVFYRPGSNDRRADADNLVAWLKASVDGIADAGIIANDRDLTWLPVSQVLGRAADGNRKVLLIVEGDS